jgi:hypothetical protein
VSLFALAIGACPLAAQYAQHSQESFGVACIGKLNAPCPVPPDLNRCPVFMRAQHLSDGSLVKTGKPAHPPGIGQRLHLTLTNPDSKQIASARVTVHGVTPKGRVMQAMPAQGGSSDATQSLSVTFSPEPDQSATADLWVPGMTAVESIALESMMYSDGTTWKVADGMACRVRPDPLMLISVR